MKKLISVILVLSILIMTLSGCQSGGVTLTDVEMGTGGTTGTYYVVGAAMASAINESSDALNVVAQPTSGSGENINLVNAGTIQFGMSNSDGVYWGYTGTGSTYTDLGEQNILGCMKLYQSTGQMITMANSGIETYADLKGKTVVLGPQSTTIVDMSKAILRSYGIDPDTDINATYGSFDEGLQRLTDGDVDATFFVAAYPTAALVNASLTNNLKFVDVDIENINAVVAEYPFYTPVVIEGGTYSGIDNDVNTLSIWTEIFVGADVSDEIVYEFVKLAMETLPNYIDTHTSCADISSEVVWQTAAPLHPGAEKYYSEMGWME